MTRFIRLWAIVASFFAVFNVAGAGLSAARDSSDCACGVCDTLDDGASVGSLASARRRHSDIV